MSMLTRYRKPGGFAQLVLLIEGCNQKKQKQLMDLILVEDKSWHQKIQDNILTREKLLALPPELTNEIFSRVPDKVLSFILHSLTPEQREKATATLTHFKKKALEELMGGAAPSVGDIEAAFMHVFKKVRDLEKDGTISFLKLAPALSLSEDKAA
ncbi:MAG: FliG C-terminal domain-containing protein [Bdellovibrionales bacterium]